MWGLSVLPGARTSGSSPELALEKPRTPCDLPASARRPRALVPTGRKPGPQAEEEEGGFLLSCSDRSCKLCD